jgi:hypothetical protein
MTSTELDAKQQHMGLLKDFQQVLRKQYPKKFAGFQEVIVNDASINTEFKTRVKADSLNTNSPSNEGTTSLVPFFIPYKAKITATLTKTVNSDRLSISPWKVQYTWQ